MVTLSSSRALRREIMGILACQDCARLPFTPESPRCLMGPPPLCPDGAPPLCHASLPPPACSRESTQGPCRVRVHAGSGQGPCRVHAGSGQGQGQGPCRVRVHAGSGQGPCRVHAGSGQGQGQGPRRVRVHTGSMQGQDPCCSKGAAHPPSDLHTYTSIRGPV